MATRRSQGREPAGPEHAWHGPWPTRLGFRYLDTGAMYRALPGWPASAESIPTTERRWRRSGAPTRSTSTAEARTQIAGDDVTEAIRQPEVDRVVSPVARQPEVRELMRERQRELAALGDSVIEGRDIGSVVAPGAEVKVYLVADEAVRAGRRRPSARESRPRRSPPTCAGATRATRPRCSPRRTPY